MADLPLIRLSGLPAWLIWLGVHIFYLIGYQNRVVVLLRWGLSFLSHGRAQGSRIIAGVPPREGGPTTTVDELILLHRGQLINRPGASGARGGGKESLIKLR